MWECYSVFQKMTTVILIYFILRVQLVAAFPYRSLRALGYYKELARDHHENVTAQIFVAFLHSLRICCSTVYYVLCVMTSPHSGNGAANELHTSNSAFPPLVNQSLLRHFFNRQTDMKHSTSHHIHTDCS